MFVIEHPDLGFLCEATYDQDGKHLGQSDLGFIIFDEDEPWIFPVACLCDSEKSARQRLQRWCDSKPREWLENIDTNKFRFFEVNTVMARIIKAPDPRETSWRNSYKA